MTTEPTFTPFRVAYVPGVTPGKWLRIWNERMPEPLVATMVTESKGIPALHDGSADMALVRLPVDVEGIHLITLYDEVAVVVVPHEHELTLLESVTIDDLADELALEATDDVTMKQVFETIGAGTGTIVVPMSVARLHNRKDVESRPVTDAPQTQVGLAWLKGNDDPRLETFVGIVRGRKANSSRQAPTPPKEAPKKKPPAKKAVVKKPVAQRYQPRKKPKGGKSRKR